MTAARVARSALKKFSCIAHSNSSSLVPRKPSEAQPHRADVVDQHVDPAVPLERVADEPPGPSGLGEVDLHGGHAVETLEGADRPGARDDAGALGGERPR